MVGRALTKLERFLPKYNSGGFDGILESNTGFDQEPTLSANFVHVDEVRLSASLCKL